MWFFLFMSWFLRYVCVFLLFFRFFWKNFVVVFSVEYSLWLLFCCWGLCGFLLCGMFMFVCLVSLFIVLRNLRWL